MTLPVTVRRPSTVLDSEGLPTNRVERALSIMASRIAEETFGGGAAARVHDLRQSVLGDEAGPGPDTLAGLAAWLPETPPRGVIDVPYFGLDRHPPLVTES